MKVTITSQGLDEITEELKTFEVKSMESLDKTLQKAAAFCTGEAKKNLTRPYPEGAIDTDQLRSNITYERVEQKDMITYRSGTNVEHAPYIECGTRPHYPPLGDESKGLIRWVIRHMGAAKGKKPVFEVEKDKDRLTVAKEIAQSIAWKIYHYGTPPKPFLRPAYIKAKQKLIRELEEKYQ